MITVTRKIFNPGLILALLVALFSTTAVLADFDAIYGDNGYFTVINTAYTNTYNAGTLAQKSSQVQADQARWLEALSFGDFNIANQWKQDEQTADQQVTADLQSKQYAALPTNIQQDWNQYNTQIGQVAQLANSATTPGSLSEAETQHIGPASSAFRTLIGDIQNYNNSNVSNYQNLLTQAGNSMALLTTVWAIIFPVLGVVGAWGISRRLKDF